MRQRLVEIGSTIIALLAYVLILGTAIAVAATVYKHIILPLFR